MFVPEIEPRFMPADRIPESAAETHSTSSITTSVVYPNISKLSCKYLAV